MRGRGLERLRWRHYRSDRKGMEGVARGTASGRAVAEPWPDAVVGLAL